jgi:uncharacterized repeat protein (TIGR01451 family)
MKKIGQIFVLSLFLFTGIVTAQPQKESLSLVMTVEREVTIKKDGKTQIKLEPVKKTSKGDILVYTLKYKNEDKEKLTSASFVTPIPEGTSYQNKSAVGKGTNILFSIDKGVLYRKPPIKYSAKTSDGKTEEKVATPDMYTHIKWVLMKDLQPGDTGNVTFKTKVR